LNELIAVSPKAAVGKTSEGRAAITCIATVQGLLRECKVVSETPPGLDFGAAALALAPTFLMKPATKNGRPVESEVTVPIHFYVDSAMDIGVPTVSVLSEVPWVQAPAVADILGEIDKKVGDRFADGKVVFQCSLNKTTGRLSDCSEVNTAPGMKQFVGVARTLTRKFQADPKALADIKTKAVVNLAFSFPDMSSPVWGQRYLGRAQWVRTFEAAPDQVLFPPAAVKAGLKTGSATVDCVIAANGALSQCAVVSESASGVGFGELAIKIAEAFVTNPWTDEGLPAQGAHVRLPIRLADTAKDGAPPTSATSPTTPSASPGSPPPAR
jgi:TonB family protein